jgi:hypothetical protein
MAFEYIYWGLTKDKPQIKFKKNLREEVGYEEGSEFSSNAWAYPFKLSSICG